MRSGSWLRYRTAAPSSGTEVSAEAIYRSDSGLTFQFLFTREKKPYNIDVDQNIQLELNTRTRTRLQITFSPSNTLSFKTRLEKIWYNKEQSPNEKGIVLFQDATCRHIVEVVPYAWAASATPCACKSRWLSSTFALKA